MVNTKDQKYDEKSCGIVTFTEQKGERLFLVLHYPGGHWDFPKGHVEDKDASEHQTAIRELTEETGIEKVEILKGFREEISYSYMRKGRLSHKLVVFFLGKTDLEEIKISHEHQGSEWLPYEEAYKKVTFDNAKNLLSKAANFLKN